MSFDIQNIRIFYTPGAMEDALTMLSCKKHLNNSLLRVSRNRGDWLWNRLISNLANNSSRGQLIIGCGADAVPYLCSFNPVTQMQKLNPDTKYVYQSILETFSFRDKHIFNQWKVQKFILKESVNPSGTSPSVSCY